jgi:hypothetical protein
MVIDTEGHQQSSGCRIKAEMHRSLSQNFDLCQSSVLFNSNLFKNTLRVFILFSLGSMLGFILNALQMEYKTNLFPNNIIIFLQTNWFFIPLCGLAGSKS